MNHMRSVVFLTFLGLTLASCSSSTSPSSFPALVDEFVYKSLSFSPVSASAQGLHKYNGQDFDRILDDMSNRGIQDQRQYYSDLHKRLVAFNKSALSPEDQA